jgi:hypothetical protein
MRFASAVLAVAALATAAGCGDDLDGVPYFAYVRTYCANTPDPPGRSAVAGRLEALRSRAAPNDRKEAVAQAITVLERLDEAYVRHAPARETRMLERQTQDAADEARLPECGMLGPRRHLPPERPEREPSG